MSTFKVGQIVVERARPRRTGEVVTMRDGWLNVAMHDTHSGYQLFKTDELLPYRVSARVSLTEYAILQGWNVRINEAAQHVTWFHKGDNWIGVAFDSRGAVVEARFRNDRGFVYWAKDGKHKRRRVYGWLRGK